MFVWYSMNITTAYYCTKILLSVFFKCIVINWLIIFVKTWLCPSSFNVSFSWKININNILLHQSRSSTSRSSRLFFNSWQSITRRSFSYNLNDTIRLNEIHDVNERSLEKKHKTEASCWFQYVTRESKISEHDIFTKIL